MNEVTQNLKFEPWRSEAEHATSRSQSPPPPILDIYERARKFISLKLEGQSWAQTRVFPSGQL